MADDKPQATVTFPEGGEEQGGGGATQPQSRNASFASNAKGRRSATANESKVSSGGRSTQAAIKLPTCPEGQTMTASGLPCERRLRKGTHRRKPGFRMPLKKEDGNMESQIIEYNCEFPNRVVVRLEYLMQTTKVRLNDKNYMDDLYEKLVDEERRSLQKATRHREKVEQNRMKKLIIDGIDKDIPKELSYLYQHPVFRVNQMLNRLKEYDHHLAVQTVEESDEITPVEPYEFNGNKFFRHLHDTGDLWVPSAQKLYDAEKLEGKIYRAKLRLKQKRREAAAEEKVLRILNNIQKQDEDEEEYEWIGGEEGEARPKKKMERPSWLVAFEKERANEDDEDAKLNKALKMDMSSKPFSAADMAVEKIKSNCVKEVGRLQEKIRISKDKEREQEAALEMKRHEQEINYLDTFNYDRARIIDNYEKRQRHGQVDDLLNRPDMKLRTADPDSKPKLKPYEELFMGPSEENMKAKANTRFATEPLFTKLQKVYGVGSTHPFHHLEAYSNEFLSDYLDNVQTGAEMVKHGDNIADMYTRELMVADDYLKDRMELLQREKAKLKQKSLSSNSDSDKSAASIISLRSEDGEE